LTQDQKTFVAILGNRVVEADGNESDSNRRLDALDNAIRQFRVTVQHAAEPSEKD
jgi:hypothetical protein